MNFLTRSRAAMRWPWPHRGLLIAAFVCASLLRARSAAACSPPFTCRGTVLYPFGGAIPSDARSVEWYSPADRSLPFDPAVLVLDHWTGTAWSPVAGTVAEVAPRLFRLTPAASFTAGDRYRLSPPIPCMDRESMAVEFVPAVVAPLGMQLGTLRATAPTEARVYQNYWVAERCADPAIGVVTDVSLDLTANARAWDSMLVLEALVDGVAFIGLPTSLGPMPGVKPGWTYAGRGVVRLATLCRPLVEFDGGVYPFSRNGGLAEGDHVVQFRARVVGTDTVIATESISVSLRCGSVAGDAGAPADAGSAGDAGTPADVATVLDDGVAIDGGRMGGPIGAASCGCRIVHSERRFGAARMLALVACAMWLRRFSSTRQVRRN